MERDRKERLGEKKKRRKRRDKRMFINKIEI
jgi:hypothetical protein